MDLLPDDLKSKIFQELDAVHLCRLAVVSKSTKSLADAHESWKIVYGYPKHEAKEIHLKNSQDFFVATSNFKRREVERDFATSRVLETAQQMCKVEKRTVSRYKEADMNSFIWNTYNTAVSDLVFAEDQLDIAEKNFEEAELELWQVNKVAKTEFYNLRVPLRLRRTAEEALEEWKAECSKSLHVENIAAERRAWWIPRNARYAFRAINEWRGVTASDLLTKCK